MSEGVRFNVCDSDCRLGDVEIDGAEYMAAKRALDEIEAALPRTPHGELIPQTDEELEALRRQLIENLSNDSGDLPAANFLARMPEVVTADYQCECRKENGECAHHQPIPTLELKGM